MSWVLDQTVETQAGLVAAGTAGNGPPMVLAHGWPWSSFSWHRVIPLLTEDFTVYWYDMPGYGQSQKHRDQRTSLDIQGQVFSEMLSHWGLDHPAVVAHDFGGATTLRAHLLHGSEFSRYLLMNVVAMRPWGSTFFDHVGRHVEAFMGLPPHIHQAVVTSYIQGALISEIDPDDLNRLISPWLSDVGKDSFYNQFAQADEKYTAEVEPWFGQVRCPTQIVWGEEDPWIPLERGKALHACMPNADFKTLAGLGHLPQLESAARVADSILNFFKN